MRNQESPEGNTSSFWGPNKKLLLRGIMGLLLLAGLGYFVLWLQRSVEANFAFQQEAYQSKCWFADESEVSSWGAFWGDSVVSRVWDFGDGAQDSGQIVSHLYQEPGTYQVRLVVNSTFAADTLSQEVTISPSWELTFDSNPVKDSAIIYFEAETHKLYPSTSHTNALLYDSLKSLSAHVRSHYHLQKQFIWKLVHQDTAWGDRVGFEFPQGKHDVELALQVNQAWVDTILGSAILPFSSTMDTITHVKIGVTYYDPSEKVKKDSSRKAHIAQQLSQDVTFAPVPSYLSFKRVGVRYWPHILTALILLIYLLYEFRLYRRGRQRNPHHTPMEKLSWRRRAVLITMPILLFWSGYYLLHDPFVKVVTYVPASDTDISFSHYQNPCYLPLYQRIYELPSDSTIKKRRDSIHFPASVKIPHVGDYELITTMIMFDSIQSEEIRIVENRHLKKLKFEIKDSLSFINGKTNTSELLSNRVIRAEEAGDSLQPLSFSDILIVPVDELEKYQPILDHFPQKNRKLAFLNPEFNDTIFQYEISPTFFISGFFRSWKNKTIDAFEERNPHFFENTIAASFPAHTTFVEDILQTNIRMMTLFHVHEDSLDYRLLAQLASLEKLSFTEENDPEIYGKLFEINHLESLKQLCFFDCKLLDLSELKGLSKLELLSLPFCAEARNITAMNHLPNLKWISFPSNTTQEEFDAVIAGHPALEVIELFHCPLITDLRSLRNLYNLKGIIIIDPEWETSKRHAVDYRALYDLKHLDFVHFPYQVYEDSIPEEIDMINALFEELPQTSILPVYGLCLGSGWLLLVLPFTVIFYFFFWYFRNKSTPAN